MSDHDSNELQPVLTTDRPRAAPEAPTLTKAMLAEMLFERVGLNKREAMDLVESFFGEIANALERGEAVKLSGFGGFQLHDKPQRPGRNPKTGDTIPIAARRVVTFQASQKLKAGCEGEHGKRDRNTQPQTSRPEIKRSRAMTFFVWNDELSVGNTFIDNDHRHFITLLNNLYDAMDSGLSRDVLESILDDLIQYTGEHFKREENVMRDLNYAEYPEHLKEHEKLTRTVLEMRREFMAGETKLALGLLKYLFNWLFEHIMHVDKKLGLAIQHAESAQEDRIHGIRGHGPRLCEILEK